MLASRNSAESVADPLMVMKLWLIMSGIYIWEFVTTLDFEWSFIRRQQPYRWTIWIYSASRLSGLAVIIIILIDFFDTSPINCQARATSAWAFSALGGYGLSSILIMLRIYAIWDKSKVIMGISAAIWVVNLGFQLAGIVKIRAEWVPAARSCAITNVEISRGLYITLLVTDVILLLIMVAGLLRLRRGGGSFYLSHLLWKQGVIWLAIATASQLPQVLLLFLSVNEPLNVSALPGGVANSINGSETGNTNLPLASQLYQVFLVVPSMVAMILAATRTYRSLIRSASPPDIHFGEPDSPNLPKTKRLVPHTKDSSVVHIPSNRLEVTVHKAYHEEYPVSQTNHYGLYPSSDAQLTDKSDEPGSDDNVEGRDEKQ